jgi:hypothetical protein
MAALQGMPERKPSLESHSVGDEHKYEGAETVIVGQIVIRKNLPC